MKPFTRPVRPEDVGELVDLTVASDAETQSMAELQLQGVAAIYNILCKRGFAYLADEVGMGKTYQALALVALVWNEKPDARVLFISPRQNLQVKWHGDYTRFFASNYRRKQGLGDDRAASVMFGEPLHRPELFHNLRSWTPTICLSERIAPFVRHSSFTRPVYLTSQDLGDLSTLWETTSQRLRSWGLFGVERPRELSGDNASETLNLAFAKALNARLASEAGERAYFDLVIVDEAQCLRNPYNQTNRVLFEVFKGQVRKWLFISATPAHGGPEDLPRILNHYPSDGVILDPNLVHDLPAMQKALQAFLVRRQRSYRVGGTGKMVEKQEYRNHDAEGWGVRDDEMSALATLATGLVQKGLVSVLRGRSNRYRIGFLSSFESLQSSIKRTLPAPASDNDEKEEEAAGDWHRDQADTLTEPEALDTGFIERLADSFEESFAMPMPHPKLDSVVDRVAPLAFGVNSEKGGQKFLIFTRRVSTVDALRRRLMRRYHKSIEDRILRCWGEELDWSGKGVRVEESEETDDPEGFDADQEQSPFREAMSSKGWLFRYRQTFRASGRNALFFEDGWLRRLCRAGGVEPRTAAADLSDRLWAESWTHASSLAGARRRQHRAERARYLAVQGIRRTPQVFGLDAESAAPWQAAYEAALHRHLDRAEPARKPHRARELFTQPTLWTEWDDRFSDGPLSLPVRLAQGVEVDVDRDKLRDELCRRQVVRTLLGQMFRLTDTLLDLYFADEQGGRDAESLPRRFLDWLASADPGARQVQHDCAQWIQHARLIVDSCLDGAGRGWRDLAREESWPQLYNPMAVIGVVGGSGAHRVATRQFRAPSLPRVIVCTDTLKEGVDLHLFCDQVLHYGVAWTSGDLEQRVGRVDRFFSQIERRLHSEGAPPEVELHVGYPHVVASLERGQIERVIERQKRAEVLMDSPLAGTPRESKEMVVGTSAPREAERTLEPYAFQRNQYPQRGRQVVVVSKRGARKAADHYCCWHEQLTKAMEDFGWEMFPNDRMPARATTLHREARNLRLEWRFDAALGRYVITLSVVPRRGIAGANPRAWRGPLGRGLREEPCIGLLVPTPREGADSRLFSCLAAALEGKPPRSDSNAATRWGGPLASLANGGVDWVSAHKARAVIPRRDREQRISLNAREGGVRISSVVARLVELEHRSEWGGRPTAGHVGAWAREVTSGFALGRLMVRERDRLVFGIDVLHGKMSRKSRRQLINEVAWRADAWEATLTGAD